MSARSWTQQPDLSPLGSARQRLDPAPPSAWPVELLAELRDADLGAESLFLAFEAARWADGLSPTERRTWLGLVVRGLLAAAGGSTRIAVDAQARRLLAKIPALVGAPGSRKPFILEGEHLYHQKLLWYEDRLVAEIRARAGQPSGFGTPAPARQLDRVIAAVVASAAPTPSAEQQAAVKAALGSRLAVVSGGPGTGKTTVALSMVRALVRLGVPAVAIGLAAPTGKAANRLEESIKAGLGRLSPRAPEDDALLASLPTAQTLHRLLGYSPSSGRFHHHRNNRLAHKVVIVDESSMIDLFLMERLLGALAEDTQLVLLGDADQLPSVDAGAVFRDMAPLAVRLAQSHRVDPSRSAGRRILDVAAKIRDGDAAALAHLIVERPETTAVASGDLEGVVLVPEAGRSALLESWYTSRIAGLRDFDRIASAIRELGSDGFGAADAAQLTALHAHLQSFRLLCVTRARATGVVATNAWLHARHGGGAEAFVAGEPIMMLRNDYDRGLWNGDQGLVVRARQAAGKARLIAAFPTDAGSRWAAWDLDGLRDTIELSFAITVHKAQGSEFDDVALVLPDEPVPLLTRELLYTALSRSRRAVILCGSHAVLAAGVSRVHARSSGVGEKLARGV